MAIKFLNSVNADSGVLYVDAANDRVGIGTTSPSDILSVNSSSTETILHLTNTSTGTATSDGLRIGLVGASAYFLLRENANMLFHTNNTERIRITSAGNVGIGTTSPDEKLTVSGNIRIANNAKLYLWNDHDVNFIDYKEWQTSSSGGMTIENQSSTGHVNIISNGNTGFYLNNIGNVGIGTTSPARKLQIGDGTADDRIRVYFSDNTYTEQTGYGMEFSRPASYIRPLTDNINNLYIGQSTKTWATLQTDATSHSFNNNGSTLMYIASDGDVGIGTTSPTAKLDVSGKIQNNAVIESKSGGTSSYIAHSASTDTYIAIAGRVDSYPAPSANASSIVTTRDGGTYPFNSYGHLVISSRHDSSRDILFRTNNTDRMVIQGDGDVGIGTTSPTAPLTFGKSVYGAESSENYFRIKFQDQGGTHNDVGIGQPASGALGFNVTAGNYFSFNNGTSGEIARLNGTGLGIGTTSPSYKLEVNADSTSGVMSVKNAANSRDTFRSENAAGTRTFNIGNDASGHGIVLVRNSSGTTTSYISGSGDSYFNGGDVGIGTTSPNEKLDVVGNIQASGSRFIRAEYDSNHYMQLESNSSGGILKGLDGGTATILLRSYGDSYFATGNFGIGTSSPSEKLEVSGNILASGDITAYSDARIKENVETLPNALESVKAMRGVTYNKIGEEKQSIGVIAQEVQAVLPQLVSEHKDEMLSVAYGNITAVLIEAIKEQQDIISQLEERIIDLENRF